MQTTVFLLYGPSGGTVRFICTTGILPSPHSLSVNSLPPIAAPVFAALSQNRQSCHSERSEESAFPKPHATTTIAEA